MMSSTQETTSPKPPIFICGCPKSGTTLLRALLDSHPELLIFPMETKFFRYTDYPTLLPEFKLSRESDVNALVATMLESRFFKTLLRKDNLTFVGNEKPPDYQIDPIKFERHFADVSNIQNLRELLLHLFEAFLVSRNRPPRDLSDYRIVEKTPFQEEYALFLKQWFPQAQFIHVVRNPYANFVSLRKREQTAGWQLSEALNRKILKWLDLSTYFLARNERLIGTDSYFVLPYERLVQKPEQTMGEVSSFLRIAYQESLLQPTQGKQVWSGNSMFDQPFTGIDASPVDRWKDQLSTEEIGLVNDSLNNAFETLAYPRQIG